MNPPHPDSEAALELETIDLFEQLKYTIANCYNEWNSGTSTLGRETRSDVVLISKLRPALEKLNPHLPNQAINLAIEELTRDRSALTLASANREIYTLLKDRVKVTYRNDDGEDVTENVTVIDWQTPTKNDFFLASQLSIVGEMYTRRPDLIGFVNGIPLIFIELKASRERVEFAYQNNFCDYRKEIPQLFWYNSLVILSNGSISKIGSLTATWEYFSDWKKINSEGEEGIISLDTMIRGTCDKIKLLDIVENFTLFSEEQGGLIKLVAKNHQYLGVNNCLEAVKNIRENPESIIVAEDNGALIGTVFIIYDPWNSFVYHLGVHPDYREKGLANKLMDEAEGKLKARGFNRPTLFVEEENEQVVEFYNKRGWFVLYKVFCMEKEL